MIKIKLNEGEPIDSAINRLRNKMELEGILDDMKSHRYHENKRATAKRKARSRKKRAEYPWSYTPYEEIVLPQIKKAHV